MKQSFSMNNLILIDPLGNEVLLPEGLCDFKKLNVDSDEVYDKPSKVIESPAIMLQSENGPDEHFYFRALGWNSNLLIAAKRVNGKWTAHEVTKNPTSQQLGAIYKKSREVNFKYSYN
jgi:hypothetical protein